MFQPFGSGSQGVWLLATLAARWRQRYGETRFRFVDVNSLGYMALIGVLLIFFHRGMSWWWVDVLVHFAFVVGAAELVRAAERNPQRALLWAARTFYPILFYTYAFVELNRTALMFYGTFWMSDYLARADRALFGVYPTVWAEQFYTPWLDELMAIGYCTYYLAAPAVAGYFFVRGKREEALEALGIVTFGYFVNDILFYLLPAVSPRMIPWLASLHERDYAGYAVASALRLLEGKEGVVRGGCFPSSHVTGVLSWALAAWRFHRGLGVAFFVATAGVVVSTVYLRYHHGVDPLAGLVLGFACYSVSVFVLRCRGEDPLWNECPRNGCKRICGESSRRRSG